MPTEVYTNHQAQSGAGTQDVSQCPNCSQLMPREMRFCRACGCRLGEGVEEYTETVRFQNVPPTARPRNAQTASAARSQTSPTGVRDWGAMMAHDIVAQSLRATTAGLAQWKRGCRRRRRVPRWMIWVFLPIIAVSFLSNSTSFRHRGNSSATTSAQTSYIGVDSKYANGGALIKEISPPGSPADQAGLVGGDLITSFDGKPVTKDNGLSTLLSQTPTGKTVDVVYARDGETRTTKLTTVSNKEMDRLRGAFEDRPEGQGEFGIADDDDAKVVPVPGMTINGVRLGDLQENRPAEIAGVRKGDIVIQMDQTPIRTVEEFVSRIHRALPYSTINLVVIRDGNRLEIPVKMGKHQ